MEGDVDFSPFFAHRFKTFITFALERAWMSGLCPVLPTENKGFAD